MTADHIPLAFVSSGPTVSDRLVLAVLAFYANDRGYVERPLTDLCRAAGISKRRMIRAVGTLIEVGEIRGQGNGYIVRGI